MSKYVLTVEQQKYAADNHKLIYKFLCEKKLSEDEYYDIVVFGFLRAVKKYLENPSLNKYSFSTVAWREMHFCLIDHFKSQQRKKRYAEIISLNTVFDDVYNPIDPFLLEFETELLLHEISSIVSPQQMQILLMRKDGHPIREISKKQQIPMKIIQDFLLDIQEVIVSLCFG